MLFVLALFLAQFLALAAFAVPGSAQTDAPLAGCPDEERFELMKIMDHEHMHRHIGTEADQNGDGWICMYHIDNNFHLHFDNTVPFS